MTSGNTSPGGPAGGAPRDAGGPDGATVIRGLEGFGASSGIHTIRILSLTEHLPLAIIIVDVTDKTCSYLPQAEELITSAWSSSTRPR